MGEWVVDGNRVGSILEWKKDAMVYRPHLMWKGQEEEVTEEEVETSMKCFNKY